MNMFTWNWGIWNKRRKGQVEEYYEGVLHLANWLHIIKAIDMYFTTIFDARLFPHLRLTIVNMK
jgi:hypothetical protein